ncbi:serine protein kinase RIO [Nocardioides sp. R-C-SC26]|uniref:serine protein kinase RIO n=1 Tax=Nocardioides sp. R-C-SC26 TaxID=2870414 RepID=UPI001E3E96FD|nr:RIO1 family regulatory kinase/ATPase [Nocardioides sp. R-C-SC26]
MTTRDPEQFPHDPDLNLATSGATEIDGDLPFDWTVYDDLDDGQRWTTWHDVEPLCRGPQPLPEWVVTSRGAIDTDLGILKTGKEADVFLLERADPHDPSQQVVMAAKRYRSPEHRSFHRSAAYTEGRSMKRSRDERAVQRKSTFGRLLAAGEWAGSEWDALKRWWGLGLPVPYPVQIDGTEILMEWICVDGETAPRLAQTRPDAARLADYFEQLRAALVTLAQAGLVHGDLSPYNILAAGDRLVIIDLPQVVDLAGNLAGMDFLMRDCTNIATWFTRRGLEVDEHALFGDLVAHAL